ncbi:MAG: flagellar filament capping protein FliD [Phaeospirillum sp.]|nr:flagellar filament capping protein FliD [Phaeospirillum sp.]
MTTTALSALPSSLASLLSSYSTKAHGDAAGTATPAAVPAGGGLGADPAYTLTLGQQASSSALVGYTRLATLGGQFENTMAQLEEPAGSTNQGSGSVIVDVRQLAAPQTLLSGAFGDSDHVSLGAGALSIETGTISADGHFIAKDDGISIPIKTGTLDDIVASINAADSGVLASVVEEGGGYALLLTGSATGADRAFRLHGLPELAFDPAAPNASPLTVGQTAQDAVYTIDGTDFDFSSNSKVPVAYGITTDFTAIGVVKVAKPPQPEAIESLVTAFNTIQQSIAKMAGKDGDLAKDIHLAAGMFKSLGDAATGTFETGGALSSLAQIGVTVQPDGTLNVDQTALSEAVADSPSDLQSLIFAVSKALDDAMTPYLGSRGSITSLSNILSAQIRQGSSLLDYLNGDASSAGSGSHKNLLDYLNEDSADSFGGSASSGAQLAANG